MRTRVELTDQELLLLDGKCSEVVQSEVEKAKSRASIISEFPGFSLAEAKLIVDAVAYARKEGKLFYRVRNERKCNVCGKNEGYGTIKRRTKYKKKGDIDFNNPITHYGVDLEYGGVIVTNCIYLGCCLECFKKIQLHLITKLAEVEAEVPKEITGHDPLYKAYDRRKCVSCQWEGHEGEMGRLPCMMGGGTYPGVCPKCGARSLIFNHQFDILPGRTVVRVETKS